jgi:glutamate carboxypeptidase
MVASESGSSYVRVWRDGRLYRGAEGARRQTERRKTTRSAGADMVIGTFEGTGSRKLMLIAHMTPS